MSELCGDGEVPGEPKAEKWRSGQEGKLFPLSDILSITNAKKFELGFTGARSSIIAGFLILLPLEYVALVGHSLAKFL